MKVSCIIPTRNRCKMVLEAIESVMRQQYFNLELILVDDGSVDNTLAEVHAKFPDIYTVRLTGEGPGTARNAGVAASSGDILMFLDSDDLWLNSHVRQLVDTLQRGFQVAYGTTRTIDEINGTEFLIPEKDAAIEGDCFHALIRWCFLIPSALAIRREAFIQTGGFASVPYGEDWIFFLKLAAKFPFGYSGSEPITLRRLHRGSLCFLGDKKKLLAIISQLLTVLENEPRATAIHRKHFTTLLEWTANNMEQWATVQDWYLAMLKEKII